MRFPPLFALFFLVLPACQMKEESSEHEEHHQIVVTSPQAQEVTITQPYVCQIHSQRHINVCALVNGFLEQILVKEGQAVKKGDVMFKILPVLYQAKMDAEAAEVQLAQLEYNNTKRLFEDKSKVVSEQEVFLYKAKLAKAEAKLKLAQSELNFATVRAPFDGIIDRLHQQQGSLIKEGEKLTTLSDNSLMWVYFNVPESRYLDYKSREEKSAVHSNQLKLVDSRIELQLADGSKFDQDAGDAVTVEAQFNNETGNIAFRADFPNPDRLLRHGQTGTVLIHRKLRNAVVIPQRSTFEVLDKMYVRIIGDDHVVRQQPITIAHELEDKFVIAGGLSVKDKIILEGVKLVKEGDHIEHYEFEKPENVLSHQKFHAE